MPLDTFPLLQDHTRLIRYNNTLYKLKIKYDPNTAYDKQIIERSAHHELEQVFRAVLYKNERNIPLKPIVTPKFLVKPLKIQWGFPIKNKNYKFTLYGKTLKVYEFMFEFHVSKNNINESAVDDVEKTHKNINHSVIGKETVEGSNIDGIVNVSIETENNNENIEESGVKRILRFHRGKDGNLFRDSTRRGKSPLLGEKRVKGCNNKEKVKDDGGVAKDEKYTVKSAAIPKSPVRNDRRASKRHLDLEKPGHSCTVPRLNDAQKKAEEKCWGVNAASLSKRESTSNSVAKSAKKGKFSLKRTELASLGTVQESRLRNRSRVQSRISNRRSRIMPPRQARRFSEMKQVLLRRTRTKVHSDQYESETDNDTENNGHQIESINSVTENFGEARITRNTKGKKNLSKDRNESVEKQQKRKYADIYTRRSRGLSSSELDNNSRLQPSVSSSEDSSTERNYSGIRNRRKSQRFSTVGLREKASASSESDCSPNKRKFDASNRSEERSDKSSNSRKVKLYAARSSPHPICESGVTEITSPRVSAVRPFNRKAPVKAAQQTISQNVQYLSPRRTRQSLHDSESHMLERLRSQIPSKVYTDMMLKIGKDGQKIEQEKAEVNKGQQMIEPTIHCHSSRKPSTESATPCQSPRLAAVGKNKRRSSGIWGKIMDALVNPTTGFMFGNK